MRQFVAQTNFDSKGLLAVSGKDYRYFKNVLRLAAGDMVCVRTPDGKLCNTTVCKIDEGGKKVVLQLCASSPVSEDLNQDFAQENQPVVNNGIEWQLFMFVPKSSKFDLIVRQAAECGAAAVIPVQSEFSQSGAEKMNFRSERLERIIKEARQQSGSAVNTVVEDCISVKELCRRWKGNCGEDSFCCVLYERSEKTKGIHEALKSCGGLKKCALVCGAEGGISPDEIEMMSEAGIVPVHFETNILRCETAALYGMAALQSAVTEIKKWQ